MIIFQREKTINHCPLSFGEPVQLTEPDLEDRLVSSNFFNDAQKNGMGSLEARVEHTTVFFELTISSLKAL